MLTLTLFRSRRVVLAVLLACGAATAQDAHEALGAKDDPQSKAPSPLTAMMATLPSTLKPELAGVQ